MFGKVRIGPSLPCIWDGPIPFLVYLFLLLTDSAPEPDAIPPDNKDDTLRPMPPRRPCGGFNTLKISYKDFHDIGVESGDLMILWPQNNCTFVL